MTFGSDDNAATILPATSWRYELKLSQPIYSGGRATRALEQAGIGINVARQQALGTRQGVLLRTTSDYLGVIQGAALVTVETQNVELARKRLEQAKAFYDAGESTKVDVLRAESAVKASERRLAAAVQAKESAASELRIDLAVDQPVAVASGALSLPAVPERPALLAQAFSARPEIRQAELNLRFNQIEVEKQKRKYLPVITSDATYTTQASDFPAPQYGALSFNLHLPIFDSFEIAHQVAIATQQRTQASLALEEMKRGVREQVDLSLIHLKTAQTNLDLARDQLAASEAEYQQMFDLYRAQEATALDLESAETSLAEARRAVATGELDLDLARLSVWYATGTLEPVLMTEETQ